MDFHTLLGHLSEIYGAIAIKSTKLDIFDEMGEGSGGQRSMGHVGDSLVCLDPRF